MLWKAPAGEPLRVLSLTDSLTTGAPQRRLASADRLRHQKSRLEAVRPPACATCSTSPGIGPPKRLSAIDGDTCGRRKLVSFVCACGSFFADLRGSFERAHKRP